MRSFFRSRHFCLLLLVPTLSAKVFGLTTTYMFDSTVDNVFNTIAPNPLSTGFAAWPSQLADTRSLVENNAGVIVENQLNAPLSFNNSADIVNQSTILSGDIAWAKPRAIEDQPYVIIDFTNRVGGVPMEISFDFAISVPLPGYAVQAFDTEGDSETLTGPVTAFSFNNGQGTGSEGRVTLTPTGSLDNLARIRFDFGGGEQLGIDNVTFDNSVLADFNESGFVDDEDLQIWSTAYNSGNSSTGDADGDDDTDGVDFLVWQREYTGPPPQFISPVPEPSSIGLTMLATLMLFLGQRKQCF